MVDIKEDIQMLIRIGNKTIACTIHKIKELRSKMMTSYGMMSEKQDRHLNTIKMKIIQMYAENLMMMYFPHQVT